MTSKIDLRDIFVEHFRTLRDSSTNKFSWSDLFIFFGIPAAVSGFIFSIGISLSTTAIGILIGALSILAGLLINVLVLLYTVKEIGPTDSEKLDQRALIREVNSNLLYAITISIVDIVALCLIPAAPKCVQFALTPFVIFVLCNFILTLLMAIKRLKVLLDLRFR